MYVMGLCSSSKSSNSYLQFNPSGERMDKYIWYSIIFYTIIVSIRYRVGADCESYADSLLDFAKGNYHEGRGHELEPIAILFGNIVNFFGGSRVLLLGLYGFCEVFFIEYALRSRKALLPFVGALIILGPFWFDLNNGLRQVTVTCMLLYAIQQLVDYCRWKKFLLLVFLGYFMHKSALILMPLVLLVFYDKLPNRWIMIGSLLLCIGLGSSGVVNQFISQGESYIKMFGYAEYSDRMDYFIEQESLVSNYGPRRIVMFLSYVLFMWFSSHVDDFVGHDKFFRVCLLLAFAYVCLSELLVSSFFIFSRPLGYVHIFVLISIAYTLYYLKCKTQSLIFLAGLILCCSYVLIECLAVYSNPNEYSLYKFIFLKELY